MTTRKYSTDDTTVLRPTRKVRRSVYSVKGRRSWMTFVWDYLDGEWDHILPGGIETDDWHEDDDDWSEDDDWYDDPDDQPVLPITLSLLRTALEDDDQYARAMDTDEYDFPDFEASADEIEDDMPPDEPSDPVIW